MKNNFNAFSLVEILIASSILSIAIFWVYKLIWENTKIIWNSDNILSVNQLFIPLTECIENIWFITLYNNINTDFIFNFWSDNYWCNFNTSNIVKFDWIEYELFWKKINTWPEFIEWELWIKTDLSWKISRNYKQIKN